MSNDRVFWLAVYRGLMAIAAAIKRYRLEAKDDDEVIKENVDYSISTNNTRSK